MKFIGENYVVYVFIAVDCAYVVVSTFSLLDTLSATFYSDREFSALFYKMSIYSNIFFVFLLIAAASEATLQDDANNLKLKIMQNDQKLPQTPEELAYATLLKGFAKANPDGISAMELVEKVQQLEGSNRHYLIRFAEMLDFNEDGHITSEEIAMKLKDAMGSVAGAINFMFNAKDFDQNGLITPWELMRENMILEGNTMPMSILWQMAKQEINSKSLDDDGRIDEEEYLLSTVQQVIELIVLDRKAHKSNKTRSQKVHKHVSTHRKMTPVHSLYDT